MPDQLETLLGAEYGRKHDDSYYPRPATGQPCRGTDGDSRRKAFSLCAMVPTPGGERDEFEAGQELVPFASREAAEICCELFAEDPLGLPDIEVEGATALVVFDAAGRMVCRHRIQRGSRS